jgi:hypothetical protein
LEQPRPLRRRLCSARQRRVLHRPESQLRSRLAKQLPRPYLQHDSVGEFARLIKPTLAWWAELLVVTLTPKGCESPRAAIPDEKSDFHIVFEGIEAGHVVRRRSDAQKMHSAIFTTREQGLDHIRLDRTPRAVRNRLG